jgi:hypothetical protein
MNSIGNSPQRHRVTKEINKQNNFNTQNYLKICHSERSEESDFSQPVAENPDNLQSEIRNLKSSNSSVPLCLGGEKSPNSRLGTRDSKLETRNSKPTHNSVLGTRYSRHRRDALWQIEKAVRRSGPLLEEFPESG